MRDHSAHKSVLNLHLSRLDKPGKGIRSDCQVLNFSRGQLACVQSSAVGSLSSQNSSHFACRRKSGMFARRTHFGNRAPRLFPRRRCSVEFCLSFQLVQDFQTCLLGLDIPLGSKEHRLSEHKKCASPKGQCTFHQRKEEDLNSSLAPGKSSICVYSRDPRRLYD